MSGRDPTVSKLTLQLPAATEATQLFTPSLTVTDPVGVPFAGADTVTEKSTVTDWPIAEGSGLSEVMLVTVAPGVAVAENKTGLPWSPVAVAERVFDPVELPSVHPTSAIPLELVVALPAETLAGGEFLRHGRQGDPLVQSLEHPLLFLAEFARDDPQGERTDEFTIRPSDGAILSLVSLAVIAAGLIVLRLRGARR